MKTDLKDGDVAVIKTKAPHNFTHKCNASVDLVDTFIAMYQCVSYEEKVLEDGKAKVVTRSYGVYRPYVDGYFMMGMAVYGPKTEVLYKLPDSVALSMCVDLRRTVEDYRNDINQQGESPAQYRRL